jgi:hypothetical protein
MNAPAAGRGHALLIPPPLSVPAREDPFPQIPPPSLRPTPLRQQARLERETGHALFIGLSLSDTLREALRLGHQREAAALRKQFAVPEPRCAPVEGPTGAWGCWPGAEAGGRQEGCVLGTLRISAAQPPAGKLTLPLNPQ